MTATILIVDDLEPNIRLLEAKLLSEYYVVRTAMSGQQCINILQEEQIDVILLDVMMPEMDGFDTCKLIKADPKTTHIPVVMVTALSEIYDRVKGLEAGADEFLTKPVNDVALFARVKSLSRIKTIVDELKIRNQSNQEVGATIIKLNDDFQTSEILLIDDDAVQIKYVTKIISQITPKITTATKIEDVHELSISPDVVIISCQMKDVDPLRIAVTLKAKEKMRSSCFILMTEDENLSIVTHGMELGVNDYFSYPIDESELTARVKTQLRRKKYQDILKSNLEKSVNLSIKDGLTNIFNRRYFDMHLENLIQNYNTNASGLSLLIVDIDHFKKVNDELGHQVGDIVIKSCATIFQQSIRTTDVVARYGGEEFAVILLEANPDNIMLVANRLREAIEKYEFTIPNSDVPLKKTISIGASVYQPKMTSKELIEEADKALYLCKNLGRNKALLFSKPQ